MSIFKAVAEAITTTATRPFGRMVVALPREEWIQAVSEQLQADASLRRFQPLPPSDASPFESDYAMETALGTIVFREEALQ